MKIFDKILKSFTILILILMYLPIVIMIGFSFNSAKSLGRFTGFSLRWYSQLFEKADVWTAFYNSLTSAAVVTIISVVLALLMANAVVRYEYRGGSLIDAFIYIPIVIPEITESLSLLIFYGVIGFPLGFWSVALGHATFGATFAIVVLRARISGFRKSFEEAARTLGADEIETFFRITLPILMPGVIAAGLLAFTLSFDDFIKTSFTTGPGFTTLPLIIY
ncbi:ABC transporter permease, partial [Candidatus Bathyarchaeota archaeon]|nr:ABC transporter permease [Candidatus Bathyarchaeota archaeon]